LAFHQVSQQQNIAVGKFQGIVMDMRAVLIDLTENSGIVGDNISAPRPRA
jgi:hypothetical protein